MTELKADGTNHGPIHIHYSCLLLKNASVRNARLICPRICIREPRPSRRPRSPSSNHNVKEPPFGTNFHYAREASPPARLCTRRAARGGVYRGVISPSQTVKAPQIAEFSRRKERVRSRTGRSCFDKKFQAETRSRGSSFRFMRESLRPTL